MKKPAQIGMDQYHRDVYVQKTRKKYIDWQITNGNAIYNDCSETQNIAVFKITAS